MKFYTEKRRGRAAARNNSSNKSTKTTSLWRRACLRTSRTSFGSVWLLTKRNVSEWNNWPAIRLWWQWWWRHRLCYFARQLATTKIRSKRWARLRQKWQISRKYCTIDKTTLKPSLPNDSFIVSWTGCASSTSSTASFPREKITQKAWLTWNL